MHIQTAQLIQSDQTDRQADNRCMNI